MVRRHFPVSARCSESLVDQHIPIGIGRGVNCVGGGQAKLDAAAGAVIVGGNDELGAAADRCALVTQVLDAALPPGRYLAKHRHFRV